MGKMNELSIINDYDNIQLSMCEKEDLIEYINYLQGQLQERDDEVVEVKRQMEDGLTETIEELQVLCQPMGLRLCQQRLRLQTPEEYELKKS